jgi:hypothetical protein
MTDTDGIVRNEAQSPGLECDFFPNSSLTQKPEFECMVANFRVLYGVLEINQHRTGQCFC